MSIISAVTLPEISETPLRLNASELLPGVKATLKRVAENRESAWQGLRDSDSITRSASDRGMRAKRYAIRSVNFDLRNGKSILIDVNARGGVVDGADEGLLSRMYSAEHERARTPNQIKRAA